jgi:hypothetical protein
LTFLHTDGNRHVRLTVTVQNTTTAPLRISRDLFHAFIGEQEGSRSDASELTTFPEGLVVAPGASATGTVGYWWGGDPSPNPTQVRFAFGPLVSLQADAPAPVAAGPSVLP